MSELIEKMKENDIPQKIIEYYEKSIEKNIVNSLTQAMERQPYESIKAVSIMFEMASKFTGRSSNEILDKTGFSLKDMDQSRLDAAFAEIRTINYLGLNGFSNIELIHDKSAKYSDLIAFRNNKKICFEVMCITKYGKPKAFQDQIIKYILYRLNEKGKLNQLENTRIEFGCDYANLAVVINSEAAVALNTRSDFLEMLVKISEKCNNDFLTFSIITGNKDGFTDIPDDCTYPEVF